MAYTRRILAQNELIERFLDSASDIGKIIEDYFGRTHQKSEEELDDRAILTYAIDEDMQPGQGYRKIIEIALLDADRPDPVLNVWISVGDNEFEREIDYDESDSFEMLADDVLSSLAKEVDKNVGGPEQDYEQFQQKSEADNEELAEEAMKAVADLDFVEDAARSDVNSKGEFTIKAAIETEFQETEGKRGQTYFHENKPVIKAKEAVSRINDVFDNDFDWLFSYVGNVKGFEIQKSLVVTDYHGLNRSKTTQDDDITYVYYNETLDMQVKIEEEPV